MTCFPGDHPVEAEMDRRIELSSMSPGQHPKR
jgi:hypothetical protein